MTDILYVITSPQYADHSIYKVGFHTGNVRKLTQRYSTYLPELIIILFLPNPGARAIEKEMKNILLPYRILNNNFHYSEWVRIDLLFLLSMIMDISRQISKPAPASMSLCERYWIQNIQYDVADFSPPEYNQIYDIIYDDVMFASFPGRVQDAQIMHKLQICIESVTQMSYYLKRYIKSKEEKGDESRARKEKTSKDGKSKEEKNIIKFDAEFSELFRYDYVSSYASVREMVNLLAPEYGRGTRHWQTVSGQECIEAFLQGKSYFSLLTRLGEPTNMSSIIFPDGPEPESVALGPSIWALVFPGAPMPVAALLPASLSVASVPVAALLPPFIVHSVIDPLPFMLKRLGDGYDEALRTRTENIQHQQQMLM